MIQNEMDFSEMINDKLKTIDGCLNRAQGCFLGQLAGDALGSLVEFQTPDQIKAEYPDGVRVMADGGTFNTIAGQPTDDSEMALLLARSIIKKNKYDFKAALETYKYWLASGPFDCGVTISNALRGQLNQESQANGAMMRILPLGIFGSNYNLDKVAEWAILDSMLTHSNPVCLQANALYTMSIAHAIKTGISANELYQNILEWAKVRNVEESLMDVIVKAETRPPKDYTYHQGWVLIAFQNALWQLLHAENLEEGIVSTIMHGGDTDTNGAICGSLLGSVYGIDAIPTQWLDSILSCQPEAGNPQVYNPRPQCMWPNDALEIAEKLITNPL